MVLWVPITSHCTWEDLSGLQLFKCVDASSHGDAPLKSDCGNDGCSEVENGPYKISDTRTDFQPFEFVAPLPVPVLEFPVDEQPTTVITTSPEIPSGWQFSYRTALPPRAPSFVS